MSAVFDFEEIRKHIGPQPLFEKWTACPVDRRRAGSSAPGEHCTHCPVDRDSNCGLSCVMEATRQGIQYDE